MSSLDVYVLTFNCARNLIKPPVFALHLLDATSTSPDLLVLCLQELAPIGYAFLGGSFLEPYFKAFHTAVEIATDNYVNIIARNVGLTAIMVFAKDNITSNILSLQTAGVGVGVSGMGNKGAVGVRIEYSAGERPMQLTFVSAHLAPMEEQVDHRNQDYRKIAQQLVFTSEDEYRKEEETPLLQASMNATGTGSMYDPAAHLFFAGDLNYRTSLVRPSGEDFKKFPQPTKDPDNHAHYSHLLAHDQLSLQVKEGKSMNALLEAPIGFPPTYKYRSCDDVVTDGDQSWNWASHRWPSWCDRIFFSPTHIKPQNYQALPLFGTSDHRPVALSASVPLVPVSDAYRGASIPLTIDPKSRAKRDAARRKEVLFGATAYLTWTWEGNGLLLALTVGGLGGWLILRSMLLS